MSDSRIAPEILELIRRTSTVSGCDKVYSIAPRGHRVGFYFQQRRATLLARALRDRLGNESLKKEKIAIIGAGVSGLTLFSSLVHYGADKVYLYDSSDDMLNTGAKATHRLVHPNYNRWPMLGSMDIFTNLPVMNWCAGTADQVVRRLKEEIGATYGSEITNRFRPMHRCKTITEIKGNSKKLVRVSFDCSGGTFDEYFDVAILAVGFADEDCVTWGLEDYWTAERVPLDKGIHRREARIFGTGDGALIDALRCCAKVPEEAWEIPLGVISQLREEAASVLQVDGPRHNGEPRILRFTEWETEIQRHEESIRSASWHIIKRTDPIERDRHVMEEQVFYTNLIKRLQKERRTLCNFIDTHLKPPAADNLKPKIYGELSHPFEPTSAPINKILMAYLLETKRIEYIPSQDRLKMNAELDKIKNNNRSAAAGRIEICRYGAKRNFNSSGPVVGTNAVAVNIESDAGLNEYRETNVEGQLIDLLSGISGGEYVYFDTMPHPLELARIGAGREGVAHSTRKRFKTLVDEFARVNLEAEVRLEQSPPKWVLITSLAEEEVTEKLRRLGGIDGVFCGAPIVLSRKAVPETMPSEGFS